MSSRVGTAIPASRSTALSSAAVGLTRSIQTASSGSASISTAAAFFKELSTGTNTDSMKNSETRHAHPTGLGSGLASRLLIAGQPFVAAGWPQHGTDSAAQTGLPGNETQAAITAAKKTQPPSRSAGDASKVWNYDRFRR